MVFHCMDMPHFVIYLPTEGHLDCFQLEAITNEATMNVPVFFLCGHVLFLQDKYPAV